MNKRLCRTGEQKTGLENLVQQLPETYVIAELGSFAGESTEIFARRCRAVYAVDLWGESAAGMAKDVASGETAKDIEDRFDQVCKYFTDIIKIKARTDEAYKQFEDERFYLPSYP